jgi:two-component system, OmpR family, response regulator
MRILVVEDERRIARDIAGALQAENYLVDVCHDGEEAWFLADTETFDAIVLDLGLPGLDGLTVLKRWRQASNETPVLVLTARDGFQERIEGIDTGADDYLTKPFRMEELLARLRAILRRAVGRRSPVLTAGALDIDTRCQAVSVAGRPITLSSLEYRMLAYLVHHKGRTVPRAELFEHVYGEADEQDANTMEALVSRLRRKLAINLIETRRGQGYLVQDDNRCG